MTNRELGLVWMAAVLARLYDTGPKPAIISPDETIEGTGATLEGDPQEARQIGHGLGQWLEAEGIVRREKSRDR
jgi:hypothetical protein